MLETNLEFHSVAIVTNDIEETRSQFRRLLGLSTPTNEEYDEIHHVEEEGVEHKFTLLEIGDTSQYIEFFEPVTGPHRDLLEAQGNLSVAGFCLSVDDIESAYDHLASIGIDPVDESGAAINSKYVEYPTGSRGFFIPKDETGGMLVEIIQPYYHLD